MTARNAAIKETEQQAQIGELIIMGQMTVNTPHRRLKTQYERDIEWWDSLSTVDKVLQIELAIIQELGKAGLFGLAFAVVWVCFRFF